MWCPRRSDQPHSSSVPPQRSLMVRQYVVPPTQHPRPRLSAPVLPLGACLLHSDPTDSTPPPGTRGEHGAPAQSWQQWSCDPSPREPSRTHAGIIAKRSSFELLFLSEQTVTLKLLRTISAITPRNKTKTGESRA